MGLIVWFEPERVTPGTWLAKNHPEWILGGDGERLLNLGNPAAARGSPTTSTRCSPSRASTSTGRISTSIRSPSGAQRRADRQGITEIRHVEGYLAYWDELRRRHPGLLIDSCASGGRRNDLETLRRAVPLLRSDYQSFDGDPAYAPGNQGHTYGLSSWIPYYGQGVYYSDRQFVYSARSYLSPAFVICVDVRKPGVDWAVVRAAGRPMAAGGRLLAGRFLSADALPTGRGAVDGLAVRPAREGRRHGAGLSPRPVHV